MINGINRNYVSDQKYEIKEKQNIKSSEPQEKPSSQKGDTIEIGTGDEKKITYSNPLRRKLSSEEVEKLWQEAERATEALRKLVRDVISNQGKKSAGDSEKIDFVTDTDTLSSLQAEISDDGEWGVEAVSDRIVAFAKAVSGGDKSKLDELKRAIDKGFEEARNFLGGTLPDISYKTYDRIMEKLDQWAAEE